MPALMIYWNTVWSDAVKANDHRFRSHTPGEAAAFPQRISRYRFTMPGPVPHAR